MTIAGARQVHYRRAGNGPPLVLLPRSPRSSLALDDLVARLGERLCAIALDLPGTGSSDPLSADTAPTVGDYARATRDALDALGLACVALYGAGSGASVAAELARLEPARVACLVLDDPPLLDDDARAEALARAHPPLEPDADGAHLTRLWSYVRAQYLFSPWFDARSASRRAVDMPDPWTLNEAALDLLRAGSRYGDAERAAWQHDLRGALVGTEVPVTLLDTWNGTAADPKELGLPGRPVPPPDGLDETAGLLAGLALDALSGERAAPDPPHTTCLDHGISRSYVDTPDGQLHVRGRCDRGGVPAVMLHASPASGRVLERLARELAASRDVLVFDTLGNGESDKPPGWQRPGGAAAQPPPTWEDPGIADYARVVGAALQALGIEQVDVFGSHTGGSIAVELALTPVPPRVRALAIDGPALFSPAEVDEMLARYLPPLDPVWDGSHLTFAWQFMQAQTLFWPWYRQTASAARPVEPLPARALHTLVVEVLKSGHTYPLAYRAAFAYPARQRLGALDVPTLVCWAPGDVLESQAAEAAAIVPGGVLARLPPDAAGQASLLAHFFDER